jgi:predicted nucleic acid-binding protein
MSDRFFLDTTVFVYSFDRSAPAKARKAARLIREALTTQKGVISYRVVQEFFNVALKRFSQHMGAANAGQYLIAVFRALLAVHSSQALYAEALFLHAQSGLSQDGISWRDSLIVSAAIQTRCEILFSEDLQHGRRFGALRVMNPFL